MIIFEELPTYSIGNAKCFKQQMTSSLKYVPTYCHNYDINILQVATTRKETNPKPYHVMYLSLRAFFHDPLTRVPYSIVR